MAAEHYDLIVLGAGLAEQIAATLLAGQGYRVLSFPADSQTDEQSLTCCPALNKLLKALEGEHLLRDSTESLQLVTDDIRLQLGGPLPLAEELWREFPEHHASMLALLARLDEWGRKLSLLLSSPAPDSSLLALRLLILYRRQLGQNLPARRLQHPILKLTTTLGARKPQQALTHLLSGLCLVTPARLSIAEAALKWHIITRPQTISLSALNQLLEERYAAVGGQSLPLEELAGIIHTGKRQKGVSLLNGKLLNARQFLVGSLPEHIELHPALASTLAKRPCKPQSWTLSGLPLQRLPMLAPKVVLAGEQTLRLTWDKNSSSPGQALLETIRHTDQTVLKLESIRHQLSSVLPFTDFELTETPCPSNEKIMHKSFWPRGCLPKPVASNVLYCNGSRLLPSLGLNADLMLGQAAAGCLQKRMG
jgi:hypothetical protein